MPRIAQTGSEHIRSTDKAEQKGIGVIDTKIKRLRQGLRELAREIHTGTKKGAQVKQCRCANPAHEHHRDAHCNELATESDDYCKLCHELAKRLWDEIERNR